MRSWSTSRKVDGTPTSLVEGTDPQLSQFPATA